MYMSKIATSTVRWGVGDALYYYIVRIVEGGLPNLHNPMCASVAFKLKKCIGNLCINT